MNKPLRLKANDKVAIVSSASNVRDDNLLGEGIALLESWGLEVTDLTNHNPWHYLAAPDQERADKLNQAFADDEIKAVFCLRGGYGCARLHDYLDWQLIKSNPKILVGFSDITYLHLALANTQHRCIHGQTLAMHSYMKTAPAISVAKCYNKCSLLITKPSIQSPQSLAETPVGN